MLLFADPGPHHISPKIGYPNLTAFIFISLNVVGIDVSQFYGISSYDQTKATQETH